MYEVRKVKFKELSKGVPLMEMTFLLIKDGNYVNYFTATIDIERKKIFVSDELACLYRDDKDFAEFIMAFDINVKIKSNYIKLNYVEKVEINDSTAIIAGNMNCPCDVYITPPQGEKYFYGTNINTQSSAVMELKEIYNCFKSRHYYFSSDYNNKLLVQYLTSNNISVPCVFEDQKIKKIPEELQQLFLQSVSDVKKLSFTTKSDLFSMPGNVVSGIVSKCSPQKIRGIPYMDYFEFFAKKGCPMPSNINQAYKKVQQQEIDIYM